MIPSETDPNIMWALYYAELGWEVFPVYEPSATGCSCSNPKCDRAGKHPRTPNGFLDASSDIETIKRWWSVWPHANIGRRPKAGEFVLDLDGDKGKWFSTNEEMPETPTVATGNGVHLILNQAEGTQPKNRAGYKPGLDIRTHEGYHILPPSLHPNGKRYAWVMPPSVGVADSPRWLNELMKSTRVSGEGDVSKVDLKVKLLRPCIREMLTNTNPGAKGESGDLSHDAHLCVVREAQYQGFSRAEIMELFRRQPDYDEDTTRYQVETATKSGLEKGIVPYFCANLIERGWCTSKDSVNCVGLKNVYIHGGGAIKNNTLDTPILSKELRIVSIIRDNINSDLHNEDLLFLSTPPGGYIYQSIPESTLDDVLALTIKGDEFNRKILFIGSLLNYTKEDQLNFGLSGDSSSGKSHNCLEVVALHPKESVMKLSFTSPKAFFHDKGVVIDDDTDEPMLPRSEYMNNYMKNWDITNKDLPIEEKKIRRKEAYRDGVQEYSEHPKHLRVDLKQKLLVFVDMPSPELLTYLRSLLSHDEPSIWIKIADKGKGGENQTKNVEIIGFPTLFFNSTSFAMDAQEQTRLFLLSPDTDQEKLKKTLPFIAEKVGNRPKFKAELDANTERRRLMDHIAYIKELDIQEIIIASEDSQGVVKRFMSEHTILTPRFQRDLPRLFSLIKGYTLFNAGDRVIDENHNLYATVEDVRRGYELYKSISDSNELGLPPHVYDFYKKVMEPTLKTGIGFTRRELAKEYYMTFKSHVGDKQLAKIIQLLNETGLIIEETDPSDKRIKRIYNANLGDDKTEGDEVSVVTRVPRNSTEMRGMTFRWITDRCRESMDNTVDRDDITGHMVNVFKCGSVDDAKAILGSMLREGLLFEPRPSRIKVT